MTTTGAEHYGENVGKTGGSVKNDAESVAFGAENGPIDPKVQFIIDQWDTLPVSTNGTPYLNQSKPVFWRWFEQAESAWSAPNIPKKVFPSRFRLRNAGEPSRRAADFV